MPEAREWTREELLNNLNEAHEYITKLEAENKELKARLHEAELAIEHNKHVADEEQLRGELRFCNGVIHGLKFAIKCNGVSGGEIE